VTPVTTRATRSSVRCVPLAAAVAGVLAVTSCATTGELVAPSGERRLVARDPESGITIALTTGAWDGDPPTLPSEVTVVHAMVANMGDQPVRLAPGDLELVDARGFRYSLLDVGASFVRVPNDAASASYDRDVERSYDPGRKLDFVPFFAPGDGPARALPWGMLEPGTQMRGFLYFEPIVRTANEARLTWHIDRADQVPVFDAVFQFYVARP
jgi:hypothetical protein